MVSSMSSQSSAVRTPSQSASAEVAPRLASMSSQSSATATPSQSMSPALLPTVSSESSQSSAVSTPSQSASSAVAPRLASLSSQSSAAATPSPSASVTGGSRGTQRPSLVEKICPEGQLVSEGSSSPPHAARPRERDERRTNDKRAVCMARTLALSLPQDQYPNATRGVLRGLPKEHCLCLKRPLEAPDSS